MTVRRERVDNLVLTEKLEVGVQASSKAEV